MAKKEKNGYSRIPIGGMITKPGSSEDFHTGNWKSKRPVIDESKCINCLFCVQFCPEDCINITKDGKRGKIDLDYCKGCGICAAECPAKCIKMVPESEFEDKKEEDK